MSLLREIQEACASETTSVSTLLRKCLILAARLNHEPLRAWVESELNGYDPDGDLPEYRVVKGIQSTGTLIRFNAYGENIPLPHSIFDDDVAERFDKIRCHQGIAALENLVSRGKSILSAPWPTDVIAMYNERLEDGVQCVTARQEIPVNIFIGVIDTVRNKVLSFALDIERENPQAGEALPGSPSVSERLITQIFNQTIYGNVGNVATSSHGFQQRSLSDSALSTTKPSDAEAIKGLRRSVLIELSQNIDEHLKLKARFYGRKPTEKPIFKFTDLSIPALNRRALDAASPHLHLIFKSDELERLYGAYASLERLQGIQAEMLIALQKHQDFLQQIKDQHRRGAMAQDKYIKSISQPNQSAAYNEYSRLSLEVADIFKTVEQVKNILRP